MTTPTVVKLSTIEGVAAAAPMLLGFTPTESLVALALVGDRQRLGFAMRMDLSDTDGQEMAIGLEVAKRMRAAEAAYVILIVYTEQADTLLPRQELVDCVSAVLSATSTAPIRDAVLVRDNRAWSYLCQQPECCPPQGRPLVPTPETDALVAAHALVGKAPVADRGAIETALKAPLDDGVIAALDTATPRLPDLERFADPRTTLTVAEVADAVLALKDTTIRDGLLAYTADHPDQAASFLEHLVTRTPQPLDADVCCIYALNRYLDGDGCRAQIALDRALESDPEHSLSMLVDQALGMAMPPATLRQALGL